MHFQQASTKSSETVYSMSHLVIPPECWLRFMTCQLPAIDGLELLGDVSVVIKHWFAEVFTDTEKSNWCWNTYPFLLLSPHRDFAGL